MKRLTAIAAAAAGLLLNTWAFAAAEAQTPEAGKATREVRFSYNPSATPDAIYTRLQHVAGRACRTDGRRPLAIIATEKVCARELLSAAVVRLGRADVAALHENEMHKGEAIKLAGS